MRKTIATIILICMLTTSVGAGLLYPKKIDAQTLIGPQPVIELGPQLKVSIWEKIWMQLQKALKTAGDIAYKNSLRYFLSKVAYDTATYIATGGAGQKPLFITDWKKYFQQTADEAVGVFFEEMTSGRGQCELTGKPCRDDAHCPIVSYMGEDRKPVHDKCVGAWGGLGIDLCQPLSGQIKIDLTIAAKRALEPKKPRCDWNVIKKNLGDVRKMSLDDLAKFSTHFHPGANELGTYLTIRTGSQTYQAQQEKEKNLVRIIEGSFQSVANPITGEIRTPSTIVNTAFNTVFSKSFASQEIYTSSPVADAIGVFTNTLVSKLLERVFKKGFNPQESGVLVSDFWTLGGVPAARLFFGELAEVNYQFNIGMRLDEFVIDGDSQFNKVIDNGFSQAIENKCTLGQAIGFYQPTDDAYRGECNNLISDRAAFGFDQDGVEPDYRAGIPYRSILVLRKFRIVPVGWELAAQYYKDFDKRDERLTLKKLVNEFDNADSAYRGLVDPDWLLKMPATRCVRQGAGSDILAESVYYIGCDEPELTEEECPIDKKNYTFQRLDYCADYETCLDDTSGQCDVNDWGYCVEEKPVWNIKGTECKKKYYATCQSLINQENNQKVSYLLNTVSGYTDGVCDSSNAGCRMYCQDLEAPFEQDNWTCLVKKMGGGNKKYLNSQSQECGPGNEGCHLFYSSYTKDKSEVEIACNDIDNPPDNICEPTDPNAYGRLKNNYVKLAPDYYNCQGYTIPVVRQPSLPEVSDKNACEWDNGDPETGRPTGYYWRKDLRICVQSGYAQCANFVKHCSETDVSCKLYTPISTKDPAVPAVIDPKICPDDDPWCDDETSPAITWNDECPASCVGYQTYHQMATSFETGRDEDFIAATGQTCSEPGCDQFTNLDEVARGGEGIEYYSYLRQCIKPEEGGWTTYYTWEGSDTTGYQLKKWELKFAQDGGPEVTDGDYSQCSLTDEDCREFYDRDLNSYKRYFSKTISVSNDCHPFRRSLDQQIYMAIPSQGIACSAANSGCREYKSNRGYNYQKIINDDFEDGDVNGWLGDADISNESLRVGGHSMKVDSNTEYDLTLGDLASGYRYSIIMLAKKIGSDTDIDLILSSDAGDVTHRQSLTNEWDLYKIEFNELAQADYSNPKLKITVAGGEAYFDSLVLKKIESILLIKNSWTTPTECDYPTQGTHLNCEAYQDSDKNKINLKSFTNLCFEDVVGCELVIDSKNTANDEGSPKDDDELNYLVLNKKFSCDKDSRGCTRLGLIIPTRDDQSVYTFEDKYKIINPDDSLQECIDEELFCQAYKDEQEAPYYFKDPLARTCEYKEVDDIYDWYKSGSDEVCVKLPTNSDYDKHCIGGRSDQLDNSCESDNDCTNLTEPGSPGLCADWVGLCEQNSSGCREYQDPQEPAGCAKDILNYGPRYCKNNPSQQCMTDAVCGAEDVCAEQCNYYYYKNVEDCEQGVNPSQGCVAFCQTAEECDLIRSYKVCERNLDIICEDDSDCLTGRCVYTNIQ